MAVIISMKSFRNIVLLIIQNLKDLHSCFDFIEEMSEKEYIDGMNKCVEIYNRISALGGEFVWEERKKSLNMIAENIKCIVGK